MVRLTLRGKQVEIESTSGSAVSARYHGGVEAPNLHFVPLGELKLAVWEWPGDAPALLFAHATGFHGRCWDHIIRRFPGRRALALEFRGHGRSSVPAPPIPWPDFAQDVLAVARHFDLRNAIGIGHSMGGHSLVAAAIQQPAVFSALVLVDPVLFPREFYNAPTPDASFIARRRNRWASSTEMFERFHARLPFSAWDPEALRNYCDYALLPDGDGFVLACPPAVEAAIYGRCNAPENNLYAGIPGVTQPVTIMRAGTVPRSAVLDLNASPTGPDVAACFPHGRDVYLPDRNHYIPMEAPELVEGEIASVTARRP
jgi:pimeloyl-ACP methyl ester carboxylesterase